MTEWQRDLRNPDRHDRLDVFSALRGESDPTATQVTSSGAAWLASASRFPSSVLALWSARPGDPGVLPCGAVFDVVNAPAVFGRRMVDRLWTEGPGTGPVALHRGRMLLFAEPGTAHRLPSLLGWEEWGTAVPPLLCHGAADAVTVPAPRPAPRTRRGAVPPGGSTGISHERASEPEPPAPSRWVVAPDTRHPWLPGTEALLWACVHAARSVAPEPAAPGRRGTARTLSRG